MTDNLLTEAPRCLQQMGRERCNRSFEGKERGSVENIKQDRGADTHTRIATKDKSAEERRKRLFMIFGKNR